MEYDGSKLKVKIDKDDDRYTFQVLEMPEEWRRIGEIFKASNGWLILSNRVPTICDKLIYLRGSDKNSDNIINLFYIFKLDKVVAALREFGATIVGNAACNDHEWVTIYKGDPIYEGTLCKKCLIKQS